MLGVGARNVLLLLTDNLDFEGNEAPTNLILSVLRHLAYDFFLVQIFTMKIVCT